jgi:hypothetical protein
VDGWWGHAGPAFDDTEGDGILVLATRAGARELAAAYPTLGRVSRLERQGRHSTSRDQIADGRTAIATDMLGPSTTPMGN